MDLAPAAHCSNCIVSPFVNFFDASVLHEICEGYWIMLIWLRGYGRCPGIPRSRTEPRAPPPVPTQNGDIFFQHREAVQRGLQPAARAVEDHMNQINAKLGSDYGLFTTAQKTLTALLLKRRTKTNHALVPSCHGRYEYKHLNRG